MSVLTEMFRNLFSRPVTILYPKEKVPVPPGFRGKVVIADEKCIGCSKCSVVCPARAVMMADSPREVEFKGKHLARKKKPQVKVFKCIRCGLCERHCPADAIHLTCEPASCGPDKEEVTV